MAFNLEEITLQNTSYRRVIYTTSYQQLVLMSLKVGENIPNEIHEYTDQFIRLEEGELQVILNGNNSYKLLAGGSVTVPAKTYHQIINVGNIPAQIYTIYSPPHHPEGTHQISKPAEG